MMKSKIHTPGKIDSKGLQRCIRCKKHLNRSHEEFTPGSVVLSTPLGLEVLKMLPGDVRLCG